MPLQWMVGLYKHITVGEGATGMQNGVSVGSRNLVKVDSFSDTAGMLDDPRLENQNLDTVCDMQDGEIEATYSQDDNLTDNNSDEDWEENLAAIDTMQEIVDAFDSEGNVN